MQFPRKGQPDRPESEQLRGQNSGLGARRIIVIDETIREGMQFHGLVFTLDQRLKILEFQERLGVDICQAGYPPALFREAEIVADLAAHAKKNRFKIRTAALGRTLARDADILVKTGADPHFHLHLENTLPQDRLDSIFSELARLFSRIKKQCPDAMISLAILDLGRTDPGLLDFCLGALDPMEEIDILSLPDTSGFMAPNQVYETIKPIAEKICRTSLAVHCHNDRGMASANTFMGIIAGANVMEASAMGIGERNGIADIFTTASQLRGQGYEMGLKTDDLKGFKAYYEYVNQIAREQTGFDLLAYHTPAFGEAVHTHVAGTHAGKPFGSLSDEKYFLTPLCGRGLVKRYLDREKISHDPAQINEITLGLKELSMERGRALSPREAEVLVGKIRKKG